MPNLASWIRPKDEPFFRRALARYPEVKIWNAAEQIVPMSEMDGLLLTGGPDVSPEFLNQPVPERGRSRLLKKGRAHVHRTSTAATD